MSKKTKKDMNLWRAKTSCKLGREVLAGKSDPPGGRDGKRDGYVLFA